MGPESISEIAGLPMNTIPVLVAIAAAAFVTIRDDNRASQKQKLEAEMSISKAYNMTQAYYSKLRSGMANDTDKEYELAYLWHEASMFIRTFDRNLGSRLGIKSSFWRDGGVWSKKQIQLAKIGLEDVRRDGAIICRKA